MHVSTAPVRRTASRLCRPVTGVCAEFRGRVPRNGNFLRRIPQAVSDLPKLQEICFDPLISDFQTPFFHVFLELQVELKLLTLDLGFQKGFSCLSFADER